MRQRITFIQDPSESVDPNKLTVTSDSISTPELVAAREERITFGLDELPQELYKVLKASHELHIRWAGEKVFATRAPLVARLSPGLHVFYTPSRSNGSSYVRTPYQRRRTWLTSVQRAFMSASEEGFWRSGLCESRGAKL